MIDAHQHFWDPGDGYPWMTGPFAPLRRPFGPPDLKPKLELCGIDATVLVQSRHEIAETHQLLAMALETAWIAGVVGWVDLTDPAVSDTIALIRATPGGRYLVGLRHLVHDEADPDWLLRSDVHRGLEAVEKAGLAYDLLVRSRELQAAVEVARRFPGLRLVVDHLAKPSIRTGEIESWASLVGGFRNLDNVVCKVSGIVTEADWNSWQSHDLRPYVAEALDVFGLERLMFGSDWPVCLLAATYEQVFQTAMAILRDLTGNEPGNSLSACAVRTYRLTGSFLSDRP
ncbi:MAG TPA: amidohydrolase family protein [Acidimicrobiia bacterium]|nr:amidohydrolase family protein [Acidimicrobiia bacterium]